MRYESRIVGEWATCLGRVKKYKRIREITHNDKMEGAGQIPEMNATRRRTYLPAIVVVIAVLAVAGVGVYFALEGEEGAGNEATPAEFEVSNLVFNPSEVEVGNPVTISATVKNVGELEGIYTVELKIDGETQETKKVTLAGGESQTVSFTVTKDTPGTYTIEVNGLQRVLSVLEPATFELTNLTISPTEVELGATVTISVIVKNIGDLEGGYTVELKIDGVVESTKDVTLTGGATETVSFTVTKNESKTYDVSIDGLTNSFSVVPMSELLSASLYPAVIIGTNVHQLGFSFFNGSSQTITVTSAEFFDESGNITHTISAEDIAEIWGTGDVKAGESFSGGISFQLPYSTGELEGWWVKWYCLDTNGIEFTVTGTYFSL